MNLNFGKFIPMIILAFALKVSAQPISPHLVGTNSWYTSPSQQVWDLTAECGVKVIRIGGHAYDDNVPSKALLLGWIKQIQAMGAEPIVQVSQYETPEKAAELVRYFNIEMKGEIAPIKFWNIGNEPWLQNNRPSISSVGAMVEQYFKPRALAMKEVDPTIKIYGPDFCYYITQAMEDLFGGKNNIAGNVPGKDYYYCDGITWHRYPQDDNINLAYEGVEDFKGSIIQCKQLVDRTNAALNRTGDDALIWGIGEYNAKGGPQVHTWENGQMFGGVLGLCMKYEAKYAASWSMFENGGNRTGTDFSFIDGANMTPRASYRHMEFVAKYFKGEYLDGTSSSTDFVVYGASDGDQTAVMVMNRAAGLPKDYTLHLNDTAISGESFRLNLNAGLNLKYNDIIPPQATQVIIFKGDSITRINYTRKDFDNELPPVYANFKLAQALPVEPGNLEANPVSYSSVELKWNDQSDNEQGFILEREGNNGFELLALLPPNTSSYTDVNLSPETTYNYRISVYNSFGKSAYTPFSSATTPAAPAARAYNGPHAVPGIIQAEDFNDNEAGIGYYDTDDVNEGGAYRATGVDIETSTEGGYNLGYFAEGEWVSYLIENVRPGLYNLAFRMASNNATSTKKLNVFLDESKVGTVSASFTGGWQNWETYFLNNVEITHADPILLTLKIAGSGFNLNWIELMEATGTLRSEVRLKNKVHAFYNMQSQQIIIAANQALELAHVRIVNLMGQSCYYSKLDRFQELKINAQHWTNGVYIIAVTNHQEHYACKVTVSMNDGMQPTNQEF